MRVSRKWKFAIGTTSRVPRNSSLHYLILDIDGPLTFALWRKIIAYCPSAVLDRTRHGFHVYTNLRVSKRQFIAYARHLRADENWIEIGKKRGYWFLADKIRPITLAWPVQRMTLHAR